MAGAGKAAAAAERVQAQSGLLNLFSDYLPLSLHVVQPGRPGIWYALAPQPEGLRPVQFEIYFKQVEARYAFHRRFFAAAARSGRAVEAEHCGVWDCAAGRGLYAVAGAYRDGHGSLPELQARFEALSGRQAAGELWLSYVRSWLELPLLDAEARALLRQATGLIRDWAIEGRSPKAAAIEALKPRLARAASPRMENFANARRERLWWWAAQAQGLASWDRRDFGLTRMPGSVLALARASRPGDAEEASQLLDAARLRDAAFRWALRHGAIMGRGLSEGACLLLPTPAGSGAAARLRAVALELQASLGRELGFGLQLGLSQPLDGERLPEAFRQAEWALLMAQAKGEGLLSYQGGLSGDAQVTAFEAGRALIPATLAGQAREAKAAREAALGSAARLFPGRADLLRPQLAQWLLELYQAVRERGLLEGPAWEGARADALRGLDLARSSRELAALFAEQAERLAQLAAQPRSAPSRQRLSQARRRFEDAGAPDLRSAAKEAGLSGSRFSRLFKAQSGEGFGRYRRRQRLDKAAELLRQSALPVWRVAQECGYASASHFSQAFQAQFKSSPLQYRRRSSK